MSPHAGTAEAPPECDFHYLDTLWIQISGTLCNLRCTHCFISCSPENETLKMMEARDIYRSLDQARELGVKEIYYTGGEPFIHPEILPVLERTLEDFPASVLTNGLPVNEERADRLEQIAGRSRYSLEIRISLDDYDPARNDAVRGKGTFHQALAAYKRLYERGFMPILTVSEIRDYLEPESGGRGAYRKYAELLNSAGVDRPRIKIIPVFEMGMLDLPGQDRCVTHEMMDGYDHSLLQCSNSRTVASDGIYACPILVGEEKARLGTDSLEESLGPCSLYHPSCSTCYATGMTCKNY